MLATALIPLIEAPLVGAAAGAPELAAAGAPEPEPEAAGDPEEAACEPEAAADPEPVAAGAVAVERPAGVEVRVTPTAAQSCCAAERADWRSAPWHFEVMQDVELETNLVLRHKQALSVCWQLSKSAVPRHWMAQSGRL